MAKFSNTRKGGTGAGFAGALSNGIIKWEFDVAEALELNDATSADEFLQLTVPADTEFELLQVEVVDALDLDSGASDRVDVGDADDDDEFVTNATTLTAGTNLTIVKATFTGGQTLGSAASLYVKLTGDKVTAGTATGKLRFVARMNDTRRVAPMTNATL